MYVSVLVEINFNKTKTFTYETSNQNLKVGTRVIVPFNNRELEGFVMEVNLKKPEYETKTIIKEVDDYPVLNDEMIEIGKFMSEKTFTSLIKCYQTMLPPGAKANIKQNVSIKKDKYLRLVNNDYIAKNDSQKKILNSLKSGSILKQNSSSVKTLIKNGVIEEYEEEYFRNIINYTNIQKIVLTEEQTNIVNSIKKDTFSTSLIHGVTGSGKTYIYLELIKEVINNNKSAILLVPEISLTPQIIAIFKGEFNDRIAVFHSGLSIGEKYDEWRRINRGLVDVVIGVRSAVFAPLSNLGIIVIDEEHSSTYKQDVNPKYNTLDVAIKRAKHNEIPLVLGSATPSMETYTYAKMGKIKLYELKNRINISMPKVEVIDLKKEAKTGYNIISNPMLEKITETLLKGHQVMLLLNRRGYNTLIMCHSCGHVFKCPDCEVSLVYHKHKNKLVCHYCHFETNKPTICPTCNTEEIKYVGVGTQKIEEILQSKFENYKILRLDHDTASKKGYLEKAIHDFEAKKYDILLGTQMISKGLNFPNVTLVGVLETDYSLMIPDFRSAEKTYQLLSQVAGRSGRGKEEGTVLIQTYNPDHYSILSAIKHDYHSFYNKEVAMRKNLLYPPFSQILVIEYSAIIQQDLFNEIDKNKKYLESNDVKVLGPNFKKDKNKFILQFIIKYKKSDDIKEIVTFIEDMYENNNKIKVDFAINPNNI
jgi:primosomal protein N' (replication factor Y)